MKKLFFLGFVFSFLSVGLLAQKSISGTVVDGNGDPVIGATIVEQGTQNGTITDIDGSFAMTVANEASVIEVSYLGMSTKTETVGTRSVVDVSLSEDSEILEEVVVTALGFKEKRDEMGATNSVVDVDAVSRSGEVSVINAIGAKASNVRINRSNGDPGAGSTIRIRGANTITGDADPLIIVDGVPMNNSTTYGGGNNITGGRAGGISQQSRLSDINPNDIESVQVLKGASAGALWGSRAANGVIVITTKEGAKGKPKISYKATLSIDQVSERIPMQTTWGQGRSGVYGATRAESWGDYIPDRSGGDDVFDTSAEHFIADDGTVYYPIEEKNSQGTYVDSNWDDVIGQGGFLQHDFSISGGNDRSSYFMSLGRIDQDGIIKNSSYDRTNVRFNHKTYLNDWLTLTTKSSYTNSFSNRIQQNSNTAGLLLGLLRTPPDFDGNDYKGTHVDEDGQIFTNRHRSYRRYLADRDNPTYNNARWTVEEQDATSAVNRFFVTPQLDITPLNWLRLTLRGNADISDDQRQYFFPIGSGGDRSVGIYQEDIIGRKSFTFDAIARSSFDLTSSIDLNVTLGWSINDRKYRRTSGNITGFSVNADKQTPSLNSASENSTFSAFKSHQRSNRGYGILGFDIDDQLFVNLSNAIEASSTFSNTAVYPAADVAWVFTKKVFDTDALSFGKLRLAWGKVGVTPDPHLTQTLAEGGFSYSTYSDPLNSALWGGGFRIDNNQGNPDLEAEIKTEFEIGTDLRFLDDRLGLGFTYYTNTIDGILINKDLAPSSGFSTIYGNFGSMENNGIELDLSYKAIETADKMLGFNLNWSKNNNMVTDLSGTESIDLSGASVSSRAIVGYPLGVLYGTGSQMDDDGNFILDENGFPQTTTSPVILGDPNPDWRGGLGIDFKWKKFGVNLLLEHSQGGEFSPRTLWVLRRFGTTQETANRITLDQDLVNYAGDIVEAGSVVRGTIEDFGGGPVLLDESWYRTGIGGGFGDNQAYNFAIKDATFTKLREVSLSYVLDSDGFKNSTRLGSAVVSVTARNFFNWNKIDGIDPETNQVGVSSGFGIEYFTNPQTRSILVSLGVNF